MTYYNSLPSKGQCQGKDEATRKDLLLPLEEIEAETCNKGRDLEIGPESHKRVNCEKHRQEVFIKLCQLGGWLSPLLSM